MTVTDGYTSARHTKHENHASRRTFTWDITSTDQRYTTSTWYSMASADYSAKHDTQTRIQATCMTKQKLQRSHQRGYFTTEHPIPKYTFYTSVTLLSYFITHNEIPDPNLSLIDWCHAVSLLHPFAFH